VSTGREAKSRPLKAELLSEDPAACSTGFFEELRLHYRPKKVRVLLVAESRPAGGTFFYAGNSRLVRYTEQAFRKAYDVDAMTMPIFLAGFQAAGCYLEDLCTEPVNHIEKHSLRRAEWKRSVDYLSQRIASASPLAILPIHKGSEPFVKQAALKAGRLYLLRPAIPFPSMGNHPRYIAALSLLIQELREAAILPAYFPQSGATI
jgi:hypothetical protein